MNQLYYGDNLDIMRKYIGDESIDLCYIDPPFSSDRNYNLIYSNNEADDIAQSEAFIDTWRWNNIAEQQYCEIEYNESHRFSLQIIDLIVGLRKVLGSIGLMSYIVSMTLRIVEIHRALKQTGSFYLHCNPTASHYLKLVLDTIFCSQGGFFRNEIIWSYKTTLRLSKTHFGHDHDVILFYTKSNHSVFHPDRKDFPPSPSTLKRWGKYADSSGFVSNKYFSGSKSTIINTKDKTKGFNINQGMPRDVWDISHIAGSNKENLGYKTQKPEKLLERIIKTSSNEDDVVLDAFCGCGTAVAVSQKLNRQWIGIDITYQSISLILKRIEDSFGFEIKNAVKLNGIPKDLDSAKALANNKDDRTRKEFEKWAILTYTNNMATVNTKKGADNGIDGRAYAQDNRGNKLTYIFSVKSGVIKVGDIRDLRGVLDRENAAAGFFITLNPPTKFMKIEAVRAGYYTDWLGNEHPRIHIVLVSEIIRGVRLYNNGFFEVHKSAQKSSFIGEQMYMDKY